VKETNIASRAAGINSRHATMDGWMDRQLENTQRDRSRWASAR